MELSTTYPQDNYFTHIVYIGKSMWENEENVATCGYCAADNLESAEIRKIMKPVLTIAMRSKREAEKLEKTIHRELDRRYGARAAVWGCCALRGGDKPNRSDEWWVCSPEEIQEVMFKIFSGEL